MLRIANIRYRAATWIAWLVIAVAVLVLIVSPNAAELAAQGADQTALIVRLRVAVADAVTRGGLTAKGDIERLIADSFDLPGIARTVLGPRARLATEVQIGKMAHALDLRLVREFMRQPLLPGADGFQVIETHAAGDAEWQVVTRSRSRGAAPSMVTWQVRAMPVGPRIIDVVRDGVSAVTTLRADVAAASRTKDLDAVIAEIERRAECAAECPR